MNSKGAPTLYEKGWPDLTCHACQRFCRPRATCVQDRIIMWHQSPKGHWNGEKAATMYADLGRCLRKRFGKKTSYRVVEDGDTKGFQSGKGVAAKKKERIVSATGLGSTDAALSLQPVK